MIIFIAGGDVMAVLYWMLCLLIGLIPAYFVFRSDRKRAIPFRWLPALLRFVTFFLTAALLLAPAFPVHKTVEEQPLVLWLQDESASMKHALNKDSAAYREKAQQLWQSSSRKWDIIPLGFGTTLRQSVTFSYDQTGTDISTAVQDAVRRYQNQNIAAVVVASDGNYNIGSNPVHSLQATTIPVYTVALGDSTRPIDLSIPFARANKTAMLGNTFELTAHVRAEKLSGQSGTLRIIHHGKILAQQQFSITDNFYNRTFRFYLPADEKGLQHYTIAVAPLAGEQQVHNNRKDIFVEVLEKKINILIAASAPHPDIAAIKEALSPYPEYKIDIKYGSHIPAAVSDADLLITHDLPNRNGIRIPKHGAVPVWHIIGPHTDMQAFAKEQLLLDLQPGRGFDDRLPVLQPGFSLFTLPENIRAVMTQMPPLKVPEGRYQLKEGQVLLQQQSTSGGQHMPLWVLHSGQRPMSVLCGTGIWRWRLYAFRSFQQTESIDDLIRQTVRLLTYQSNRKPFQISLVKHRFQDQEPILFGATFRNAAGDLTNTPEAELVIQDSAGKKRSYTFNKTGKSYQLSIGSLPAGHYTFRGRVRMDASEWSDKGAFEVTAVPLESLKTYSDIPLLYQLAHSTGGQLFTLNNMTHLADALDKSPNMKPVIREDTRYYHWVDLKWLFFLVLFFAIAEWLLRKYWGL